MKNLARSCEAVGPSASKRGRGRPRISEEEKMARRERGKPKKMLELSVTVSIGGSDIDVALFPRLKMFLEEEAIAGMCSIERGGTVFHLHFQMVVRVMATSIVAVSKKIKQYLGWETDSPVGANVLCRALKQKNMLTFHGMLGYCMKDMDQPHYENFAHNVSVDDIKKGILLYTTMGLMSSRTASA
ncbi:hypothetical protein GOP47_0008140 [Adiantum capillus-veneris]|uniref:Replitron HUH endonuclease domain-containing protein n=1 Tax=Adiantum capillus-veneris TaxID=13818 RepID=A0A9D4ZKD8_ADICA|nr:hypothetical protein GOP47_0008140 [Adiantum capillus-veneris]